MSLLKKLLGQGGIGGGYQRSGHRTGHHGNRYNQHGDRGPQCLQCQAANKPGARYCHRCGQPFEAAAQCSECSAPLPPGSRFCQQCGKAANGG
ncbi:Double zinc ribbon [Serratia quinivorans]|uniref:zinc ribbon domain-containing protein n=1 Tax=Serratia quinivorans TaxID=137545 RepID=UPI0021773FBC|nr:zinc ribbon domain-containing protein [Serratia quinivorans]CAI1594908.1 Double zinc ribbon [Serratia quinivorans]